MVQIRWLNEAKTDLKEIYEYISLDSRSYAKHQVEKIRTGTEILKSQPSIGKVVEEMDVLAVKELILGNYRIIYRLVSQKRIDILMVHHSSRDLTRRLK